MFRSTFDPPGVYFDEPAPLFTLTGVRMDVCAFVGVAPRGPVRVPLPDDEIDEALRKEPFLDRQRRRRSVAVPVESFDQYRRIFGGFEGPGLLPYAVHAFFEQGGRRAYIVRIVHDYRGPEDWDAVASGVLDGVQVAGGGPVRLLARNEGAWGNRLQARVTFDTRPIAIDVDRSTVTDLFVAEDAPLVAGSTLHLTLGSGQRTLAQVASIALVPAPLEIYEHVSAAGVRELRTRLPLLKEKRRQKQVRLVAPLPRRARAIAVLETTLEIGDGVSHEVHNALGLDRAHPRSVARVLSHESSLVLPDTAWANADLEPVATWQAARVPTMFQGGVDRYADIKPDDFFDAKWAFGDDTAGSGIHALLKLPDLALACAPDLYSPISLPQPQDILDPPSLAGDEFGYCLDPAPQIRQGFAPDELRGLRLNPLEADLAVISRHQRQFVELAETTRAFIALLDVPPGLQLSQILRWRQQFPSAFAAAYHPWIVTAPSDDERDEPATIPPSAVAAGVIADRERRFGVPHGPANMVAASAVDVDRVVLPEDHAALHTAGINVFVRDPEGFRLTSARTLSVDPDYRQLSVRRLVTMIARTLERQTQWMVFEPHTAALRAQLRRAIEGLLHELYLANAFVGATEEEAFFVNCDERLNDQRAIDAGQLIAEIGIAPAEPLEFIIVRLVRNVDGRVTVEG